ncbi:YT521-B-like domain-domain-containing protein [Naematelia encephala]|uniref:YT521-B-like domain-domain-containing protein n=1 Tax=Naematelia encephala TaxID=71784 RepID=A0A1Y2AHI5_9TREE|nr:YT521-B-like domain-domain-containing protein [Naematelia encephala]
MSISRRAPFPDGDSTPRGHDFGLSNLSITDPSEPLQQLQPPPPQQQLDYYPAYPQHSPAFQQSYPAYPQFQQFYDQHDVTTMHGMPAYPHRPPVTRSNQTSPLNPSPPYPHQTPNQQPFSRPTTVQTQASFWSPPMSPAMPPFANHSRQPSYADEYGMHPGFGGPPPPSAWTSPSAPSQPYFYTPYQHQIPTMEAHPPPSDWSGASPGFPYTHRSSWNGPPPSHRQNNRLSWSGPSRPDIVDKERERKAYHPQAPARRSDFVMWVGNVPNNTSHEELWRYFNTTVPISLEGSDEPWRGPSSIFLISRSSCAFVNLSSQNDLDRAVAFFNGRALRPWDPRCPLMVCRVRRKDDDLRAGVGAQRGTGMHREWVKLQSPPAVDPVPSPASPAVLEHPPDGEGRRRDSIIDATTAHKSSESYASTNSSFLAKHFPRRVFILKSLTTAELEESVETGTWKTQRHNEPILDQAFRTSQEVILIFGANRAGEFYGYAKMVEPIDKERAKLRSTPSSGSSKKAETKDGYFLSPSLSHLTSNSPSELTPAEETQTVQKAGGQRMTDPTHAKSAPGDAQSSSSAPAAIRAQTLNPKDVQPNYFPPMPIHAPSNENQADRQAALGGSTRQAQLTTDGVLRKDTVLSPGEINERAHERGPEDEVSADGWGKPFKIEWVKVGSLPFTRTRHLRNPWNSDREVKVSRDGTEVEPNVALQLMAEWDKASTYPAI